MKGKKKILLAVVLVLVMAVGITSIVVVRKRNKIVVKVFPVSSLNSSDWFDTDTSLTGTLTSTLRCSISAFILSTSCWVNLCFIRIPLSDIFFELI